MAACIHLTASSKAEIAQNGNVAGPTKCDPGRSTKHLCFTPLAMLLQYFLVKTNVVLYEVYNIFKALSPGGVPEKGGYLLMHMRVNF